MRMASKREFAPGLVLEGRKQSAMRQRIAAAAAPARAFVLLDQGDGRRGRASVRVDDRVRLGAPIAIADDESGASLHAPVAGRVVSICRHAVVPDAGPGILIENDGSDEHDPRCEPCP